MTQQSNVFNFVKEYEGFSPHRTGGIGNGNVLDWLKNYLVSDGWNIGSHEFNYKHYNSILEAHDSDFKGMLLYYSVIGKGRLSNPLYYSLSDSTKIEIGTQLEDQNIITLISNLTKNAIENTNDCVVIESISELGDLSAINSPSDLNINFPIILVDKETYKIFTNKSLLISYEAWVEDSKTSNILAKSYSYDEQSPLVITTPISGWFTCSGERGCGIAVALEVAKELSKFHPVDLVFTNGHELGYQGAYEFVTDYQKIPTAVLHLGSCLANIDAEMISVCHSKNNKNIALHLNKLGIFPKPPINNRLEKYWAGEAKCWSFKNAPMLSIAGENAYFHTSADVVKSVTNKELLLEYVKYITKAALALVGK